MLRFKHACTHMPLTLFFKGVAEVSQMFLRDAHVLPKRFSNEKYCRQDWCQAHHHLELKSISRVPFFQGYCKGD
jgi:hypothetical protein